MEAKELRIGNYVFRENSKLINQKDDVYQIENVNHQSAFKYDPIPLTEEWLLMFGFEEIDFINGFKLNNFGMYKTSDGWYRASYQFDEAMEGKDWIINEYEIKTNFIHQLQNLYFALTGKELELN